VADVGEDDGVAAFDRAHLATVGAAQLMVAFAAFEADDHGRNACSVPTAGLPQSEARVLELLSSFRSAVQVLHFLATAQ
jgi:hypothetical protein